MLFYFYSFNFGIIGKVFLEGFCNVPINKDEGIKYLTKAASMGSTEAAEMLGSYIIFVFYYGFLTSFLAGLSDKSHSWKEIEVLHNKDFIKRWKNDWYICYIEK